MVSTTSLTPPHASLSYLPLADSYLRKSPVTPATCNLNIFILTTCLWGSEIMFVFFLFYTSGTNKGREAEHLAGDHKAIYTRKVPEERHPEYHCSLLPTICVVKKWKNYYSRHRAHMFVPNKLKSWKRPHSTELTSSEECALLESPAA